MKGGSVIIPQNKEKQYVVRKTVTTIFTFKTAPGKIPDAVLNI